MDESTIEKKGTAPMAPELEKINGIKSNKELIRQIAYMHRNGTPALFAFYSQADMHDSAETVAVLDQGGITLPDRDYYIKDDAKSVETRQKYVEHYRRCSNWPATNRTWPRPRPRRAGGGDGTGAVVDGSDRASRPQESRP